MVRSPNTLLEFTRDRSTGESSSGMSTLMLKGMKEMRVDTSSVSKVSPFTRDEVVDAMRSSNFNKGLGPDLF